jgi:hypothetical protein
MDTPEVQNSARLEAAVPLGDAESLQRLRERTDETRHPPGRVYRPGGWGIPPVSHGEPGQEPEDGASGS